MNMQEAVKNLSREELGRAGLVCFPLGWPSTWSVLVHVWNGNGRVEYQALVFAPDDEPYQVRYSDLCYSMLELIEDIERLLSEPIWRYPPRQLVFAQADVLKIDAIAEALTTARTYQETVEQHATRIAYEHELIEEASAEIRAGKTVSPSEFEALLADL